MTTMREFQILSRRTAGKWDHPYQGMQSFALGLTSETCSEVAQAFREWVLKGAPRDTLIDELGDALWYAVLLADTAGIELGAEWPTPGLGWGEPDDSAQGMVMHAFLLMSITAGDVGDHIKKVVGHGHDLNVELLNAYVYLFIARLVNLAGLAEIEIGDIVAYNLEKLAARYGDEFSHEKSRNREA